MLSLLGYIINGGKFFAIQYKKNFDIDSKKKRIINVMSEYIHVHKYDIIKTYNLDNNYNEVFEMMNIKVFQKYTSKSFYKVSKIIFIKNKLSKTIIVNEVNNIFSFIYIPLTLLFYKPCKTNCIYLDNNNVINIYNKNKKFSHLFRIVLTILKPNLIYINE